MSVALGLELLVLESDGSSHQVNLRPGLLPARGCPYIDLHASSPRERSARDSWARRPVPACVETPRQNASWEQVERTPVQE